MECTSTRLPYRRTGAFSKIALDYLDQASALQPFFVHSTDISGIQSAIELRQQSSIDRPLLVETLKQQYASVKTSVATEKNIDDLLKPTTFTITTAHQPNIFTGPLYFLYKILHAIRLAENCKTLSPAYDFVPVYYMGSEDADLEELGQFSIGGKKYTWETKQKGAVGRMKVDKHLLKQLVEAEGQVSVLPKGPELMTLIREFYKEGVTIQDATFGLVNALFADYGLVILVPDNPAFKKQMIPLFKDDLLHQTASGIVENTAAQLAAAGYKVQAHPREINLFYLEEQLRNRIERIGDKFAVTDTDLVFDEKALLDELEQHPERFSPNVILRGIFQETILPNIIFIGGGGETAYWLQLKNLFAHYKVSYPLLVLRNSFLVLEKKWEEKMNKLGFSLEEFFLPEEELLSRLVVRESDQQLRLNGTLTQTEALYDAIKKQAGSIDATLEKHVDALKTKTLYRLQELEKKMLRAEKRKFADQQRQIHAIKQAVFPNGGLQERVDNFMPYYAKWGVEFIQELYKHSLGMEQEFVVLSETRS